MVLAPTNDLQPNTLNMPGDNPWPGPSAMPRMITQGTILSQGSSVNLGNDNSPRLLLNSSPNANGNNCTGCSCKNGSMTSPAVTNQSFLINGFTPFFNGVPFPQGISGSMGNAGSLPPLNWKNRPRYAIVGIFPKNKSGGCSCGGTGAAHS
jgi:hypothetical protein